MNAKICICGHPKNIHKAHQYGSGSNGLDYCLTPGCHCLYFEPQNWLEIQDKEAQSEDDDDE